MWILNRSQIAMHRADLMFVLIAEDGSLGTAKTRRRKTTSTCYLRASERASAGRRSIGTISGISQKYTEADLIFHTEDYIAKNGCMH